MTLHLFAEPQPRFNRAVTVREVSTETARRWVADWHYTGRIPGSGWTAYGGFAPDLMAVVMLALPGNAAGVANRLGLEGFPGNLEIARVVAHPEAPRNTVSHVIAHCAPVWRRRGLHWVFSYADTGQGHHGGIYQALNAVYIGCTRAAPGFLSDGFPVHPRSLVARYGTRAWPRVRELAAAEGRRLEKVAALNSPKHLYVLPIGGPAERRAIRRALANQAMPYPKRAPTHEGLIA